MFLLDNIAEPVLFLLAFLFYSLYSLSLFFFLLSWAHLLVSIFLSAVFPWSLYLHRIQ